MKILIFGFGKVGNALAENLLTEKIHFKIVSRKDGNFKGKDFVNINTILNQNIGINNYILISTIPPDDQDEDFILKKIPEDTLRLFKKIIYISSTSVYQEGKVDEDTIPKPITSIGIRRLKIEKLWQKFNSNVSIVRSGGIYNETNNLLTRFLKSDYKIIFKNNHYTNRIHLEDLIGIVKKIVREKQSFGIYNAVDSDFLVDFKLLENLSEKYNFPKPVKVLYDKSNICNKKNSFYKVSKMVFNKRVIKELNYKFKYPKLEKYLNTIINRLV